MAKCIVVKKKQIEIEKGKVKINSLNTKKFSYATVFSAKITLDTTKATITTNGWNSAESLIYITRDLTDKTAIRLYGKFVAQHPSDTYIGRFGVMKNGINMITNPQGAGIAPVYAFVASKGVRELSSNGIIEVDVSSISGEYRVGVFGIWQGEVYAIEVI